MFIITHSISRNYKFGQVYLILVELEKPTYRLSEPFMLVQIDYSFKLTVLIQYCSFNNKQINYLSMLVLGTSA